jgi:uncharacterized protein YceH (UPF0502 family)
MNELLTPVECRALGALIEKDLTTPEYYPLTLHALQAACNQKSNRSPVVNFDEKTVARTLEDLRSKHLAWEVSAAGSRTMKYRHDVSSRMGLSPAAVSVLCELMLRGPQTAGELRARAARMHAFADAAELDQALQELMERAAGPLAARIPRSPGTRETRYAHLLCGDIPAAPNEASAPPATAMAEVRGENERLAALESAVAQLRSELDALSQRLRPVSD